MSQPSRRAWPDRRKVALVDPLRTFVTGSFREADHRTILAAALLCQVHLSKQRLVARIATQPGELDITSNKEAESHVSASVGPL